MATDGDYDVMMMMNDLEEGSLPVHRGTQMEEKAHSLDAVSPSPPHTTTTHQPTHRARSQGKDDDDDDADLLLILTLVCAPAKQ